MVTEATGSAYVELQSPSGRSTKVHDLITYQLFGWYLNVSMSRLSALYLDRGKPARCRRSVRAGGYGVTSNTLRSRILVVAFPEQDSLRRNAFSHVQVHLFA